MTAADSAEGAARFRAARELFFAYEGSLFYMSRNDQDRRYLEYGVPNSVEQRWLAELTARQLDSLDTRSNWRVINFLLHHRDTNYLEKVVAAQPLGQLWERISYLELLLKYIDSCRAAGAPPKLIVASLDAVQNRAKKLRSACRSDTSRKRVTNILGETERRQTKLSLTTTGPS